MSDRPTEGHVPSSDDEAPALTPFEVSDLGQGLLRLRRLAERLRDDPAWRKSNDAWLNQDLRRWVTTNLRTQGAQRRFGEVYAAAFGVMPKGATLLEGLLQVNSGPDLETMLASNGGLNQKRVDGGVAAVAEALAEHGRKGDEVVLTGRLITREWQKSDGSTGSSLEVDFAKVALVPGGSRSSRSAQQAPSAAWGQQGGGSNGFDQAPPF